MKERADFTKWSFDLYTYMVAMHNTQTHTKKENKSQNVEQKLGVILKTSNNPILWKTISGDSLWKEAKSTKTSDGQR